MKLSHAAMLVVLSTGCMPSYPDPREANIEVHAPDLQAAMENGLGLWKEATSDVWSKFRPCEDDRFCVTVQWAQADMDKLGRTYRNLHSSPFDSSGRADIVINPSVAGNLDTLQLVLAHELGHAFLLQHTEDPDDIMFPEITPRCVREASLEQWREKYGDNGQLRGACL